MSKRKAKRKQEKEPRSTAVTAEPVVGIDELGVHIINPDDLKTHFGSKDEPETGAQPKESDSSDQP